MARYDKYDPTIGGFRAAVAVDYPDADLGKIFGCGLNSAGQVVKGAGQTGIIGVMVVTQKPGRVGPQREVRVIDIMQRGCVTDFGPSDGANVPGVNFGTAGTVYYSDLNGIITSLSQANEVQTLTFGGTVTGGTFTITYGGQTTSAIAYNASAATVQAALVALSSIGAGNVTVTGGPGPAAYNITFGPGLGGDITAVTVNGASLTGTSPTISAADSITGLGTYIGVTVEPDRLQVSVQPQNVAAAVA